MDKEEKERKGVALGLCQWKNGYLWHQGKIWVPKEEGIRTNLIRKHQDIPQAGHGGTAKNNVAPTTQILLASNARYDKTICQELRHMPTNESGTTCTLWSDEA